MLIMESGTRDPSSSRPELVSAITKCSGLGLNWELIWGPWGVRSDHKSPE